MVVFFDQIEVPVPLGRTRADATPLRLTATFQGCQNEGICYPPMTRTIDIALPAGLVLRRHRRDCAGNRRKDGFERRSRPRLRHRGRMPRRTQRRHVRTVSADAPAAAGSELAEDSRLAAALSGPQPLVGAARASSASACCWRSRPACCR